MDTLISIFRGIGVDNTIVFQGITFVVSFFLVSALALKRLANTLAERDHRIEGRELESKKLGSELEEIKSRLEKDTLEAKKQASAIFQDLKQKALTEQKAVLAASRDTAQIEIKSVRSQISAQLDSEIKRVENEVPDIARMILEKVSGGKAIPQKLTQSKNVAPREV
jgi:F0F1-type ATP synthase membrane subunit b/b'